MASSTTFVCVGTRRCACTHKTTPHAHTDRRAQADDNACAHTANDTVHAHTADDAASLHTHEHSQADDTASPASVASPPSPRRLRPSQAFQAHAHRRCGCRHIACTLPQRFDIVEPMFEIG